MRAEDQLFSYMLLNPDTSGTTLLVGLMDQFGTEMFDWEPDTLRMEIQGIWGVEPPMENMDKIWALVTLITTNLFYVSLEAFIHICNALNGQGSDFKNYDPATVEEMCYGIAEATLIDPPEKGDEFSSEIITYMKGELEAEGFTTVPKMLKPYVGEGLVDQSSVEDVLVMDEIEAKSYWDGQAGKRADIEEYVRQRLQKLVDEIAILPLRNADAQGVEQFRQRASKALGVQTQQTTRASELAPKVPSL